MNRNILNELIGTPNKTINLDLIDEKSFYAVCPETFNSLERLHSNIYKNFIPVNRKIRTQKEIDSVKIFAFKAFLKLFYNKLDNEAKQTIHKLEGLINVKREEKISAVFEFSLKSIIKNILQDELDYILSILVITSEVEINLKKKPIRISDEKESIYLALRKYEIVNEEERLIRDRTSLRAFAINNFSKRIYDSYCTFKEKPRNLDYLDSKLTGLIKLFK